MIHEAILGIIENRHIIEGTALLIFFYLRPEGSYYREIIDMWVSPTLSILA